MTNHSTSLIVAAALGCTVASVASPAHADPADGPQAIQVRLAVRALHRTFDFHDTLADHSPGAAQPIGFELPLGSVPFGELEVYPLDFAGLSGPFDLGLMGGFERLIGTSTTALENTANQSTLSTSSSQLYGGLRARYQLGPHELGLSAAYGQHAFAISDATLGGQRGALVPSVSYSFVRTGLDARLRFSELTLGAYLGTRFVRDTGSLERDWFPGGAHTKALEGNLFAGYRLFSGVDLMAGLDYLRYAFDFDSAGNAGPAIAGGAVDQYVSGWLGVEVHAAGTSKAAPVQLGSN